MITRQAGTSSNTAPIKITVVQLHVPLFTCGWCVYDGCRKDCHLSSEWTMLPRWLVLSRYWRCRREPQARVMARVRAVSKISWERVELGMNRQFLYKVKKKACASIIKLLGGYDLVVLSKKKCILCT